MTFLGKILVVFQLVLSLCFMLFAGAVYSFQESWKDRANQVQADLTKTQTQLNDLQAEHDDFQTQMNQKLQQAADDAQRFQAQATAVQGQLETIRQELETARTERDNQRAVAQTAGDEARARRDEAAALRQTNQQLHTTLDAAVSRVRTLEDQTFNNEVSSKQLAEKHEKLLGNYATLQKVIRQNNLDDDPKAYEGQDEPPPIVEGYVRSVKKGVGTAPSFVEITLGSDDGLLKGHELFVFRADETKYLGKIRIVLVEPDKSVGMIVDQAKNGIIEAGDNVSTKL
jgi:hypothetical protein